MTSFNSKLVLCFIILISFLSTPFVVYGKYTAIFNFGDSLADTGNALRRGGSGVDQLPYGETYFHRPTGRYSNGRIMLDFFAQAEDLPFVRPYLAGGSGGDFMYGANFAVGGANALSSLREQLDWFKNLMNLLSSSGANPSKVLSNSLVFMGEIGGNDYFPLIYGKKSADEIKSYTPKIVSKISLASKELISYGARTIVMPGVTPFGCIPVVLGAFYKNESGYYDPKTGCINWLNEIADYHNQMLQKEVKNLQIQHPSVKFSYADYYWSLMKLYLNPKSFGFEDSLNPCCPNCSKKRKACNNPSSYISWDGIHYTEATYNLMAQGILRGEFAYPPIPSEP